jgi:hypothetical protein
MENGEWKMENENKSNEKKALRLFCFFELGGNEVCKAVPHARSL